VGAGRPGPNQILAAAALGPSLVAVLGGLGEGQGAPPPHYIKEGPKEEESTQPSHSLPSPSLVSRPPPPLSPLPLVCVGGMTPGRVKRLERYKGNG
jgi:hypothetical protein